MKTLALDYLNNEADRIDTQLAEFLVQCIEQAMNKEKKLKVDHGIEEDLQIDKRHLVLICEDQQCLKEIFWIYSI